MYCTFLTRPEHWQDLLLDNLAEAALASNSTARWRQGASAALTSTAHCTQCTAG